MVSETAPGAALLSDLTDVHTPNRTGPAATGWMVTCTPICRMSVALSK
jgi:hypothetical protein